ncbi:MAG: hypothetical protein WC699_03970 [Bacteroidales bacterium]|jgi:hypothetical protein
MKKIALLATAALVLVGLNSYGQDPDTSKIRIGKKQYTVIVDDDKGVRIVTDGDENVVTEDFFEKKHHNQGPRMDGTWGGFEIGLANFVNSDYKMAMPAGGEFMDLKVANSLDFSFNFAEKSLGIIKNYVGIVTGLGIQYTNYRFSSDFNLTKTADGIIAEPVTVDLDKNRLGIWHLNLPLMVEFQIPVYGENTRIKLAAGVIGGLRIGSRQVQKYTENGEKQKIKIRDDFYLRNFNYGFTARVGYHDVALFANYYPQTLFKDCMGPEIYPVTIGLHFGG